MTLVRDLSGNWYNLFSLAAGGLLLFAVAAGCGDDDDGAAGGGAVGGMAAVGGYTGGMGGAGISGGAGGTAGTAGAAGAAGSGAPPATVEQKQAACQCWLELRGLTIDRLYSQCQAKITDECVECTLRITQGASCVGMDETALVQNCLVDCLHLADLPASVEECKELTAAGTDIPEAIASGECMCENCFDIYAPCITNTACLRVMLCVAEQGCIGFACTADPVCAPIIGEAVAADASLAEPLTSTMITCSEEHACQGQTTAGTGGTAGSGGTSGTGGTAGSGGTSGTGGTAGSGGTGGTGGTSGSGG